MVVVKDKDLESGSHTTLGFLTQSTLHLPRIGQSTLTNYPERGLLTIEIPINPIRLSNKQKGVFTKKISFSFLVLSVGFSGLVGQTNSPSEIWTVSSLKLFVVILTIILVLELFFPSKS